MITLHNLLYWTPNPYMGWLLSTGTPSGHQFIQRYYDMKICHVKYEHLKTQEYLTLQAYIMYTVHYLMYCVSDTAYIYIYIYIYTHTHTHTHAHAHAHTHKYSVVFDVCILYTMAVFDVLCVSAPA